MPEVLETTGSLRRLRRGFQLANPYMRLCIAGEVFLFDWPKGRFLPEFQAELAAFDRSGDAAKTDWHVLAEPATELLPFDDETRNARLLPSPTGPRLVLKGGQWAEIDEPRRELRLHVDDSFFTPPYTKAFCTLSSFLRLALSVLLPKHGGLVLHASSISDGPLARVFAGPAAPGNRPSPAWLADAPSWATRSPY